MAVCTSTIEAMERVKEIIKEYVPEHIQRKHKRDFDTFFRHVGQAKRQDNGTGYW